jgi:DNA-binding response OmpR family regulator
MNTPTQPYADPHGLMLGIDLDVQKDNLRPRVLIIDDDDDLITLLKITFRKAGFDVAGASNHIDALARVADVKPHVILLDLMMPDVDGWTIYQQLREITAVPVIVVTASGNQDFAVRSLEMGAQDYVTKPFYTPELVARIKNALRQRKPAEPEPDMAFPSIGLRIDIVNHEVVLHGQSIYLTPQEFNVLKLLAEHAPKSLSFGAISQLLWGEDTQKHRSQIKNIIFLLRRKIEQDPGAPKLIVNYRSLGYQLNIRAAAESSDRQAS